MNTKSLIKNMLVGGMASAIAMATMVSTVVPASAAMLPQPSHRIEVASNPTFSTVGQMNAPVSQPIRVAGLGRADVKPKVFGLFSWLKRAWNSVKRAFSSVTNWFKKNSGWITTVVNAVKFVIALF